MNRIPQRSHRDHAPGDRLEPLPPPILWKVDVEGCEPQVLQGAAAALAVSQLRAVLLETDTPALQHTMEAAGFQRYQYDLFSRTLSPADAPPQANTSHNQLWIRDLAFVQQRCHTAPVLQVGGVEL